MRYQVWERDGLVEGFVKGPPQNNSEKAPNGFEPPNRHEWVKKDGEWVHDPEEAAKIRAEYDDE